ncbi:MAG: hypothetical protein JNL80_18715 [Phycisphaerae bacterium]|jgi:GNAT superfamily N-acetyltransferase|nr:hypothetical protein [Phycisphaerae bacterium]
MDSAKRSVFVDLPLPIDEATPVQILAVRDAAVIGREDLLPGRLLVADLDAQGKLTRSANSPILTSWGSGMFVPDAHRGQGIGRRLASHRESLQPLRLSCGVSQMLLPIYRKLGWRDFEMQRHVLLRSAAPVVERYLGSGILSSLGTAVGNVALVLPKVLLGRRIDKRTRGLVIERTTAFPDDCRSALEEPRATASTERSGPIIDWMLGHRFVSDPRAKQGLAIVRNGDTGKGLGYILTKTRFHERASHRGFRNVLLGSLQDWMSFAGSGLDFETLALCAMAELVRDGVSGIEICVPPQENARALRGLGFVRLGAQHFLFSAAPDSPLAAKHFSDPAAWWFRPADGDNVFV